MSDELDETAGSFERAPRAAGIAFPGVEIAHFVVRDRLGSGGMGVVYLAHDPTLERDVAVKLLHPEAANSETSRVRLLREARALGKVKHPNVVVVHEAGVSGGQVYVAMEHVAGGTLADWLAEKKRGVAEIVAIFLAAGRGLAAAHHAGLVHRDFKPTNVLVSRDGQVRVTDFGLAALPAAHAPSADARSGSLTETGAVLGTPRYMAPEQHEGRVAGPAADQFAFAVSLHEALSGRHPFGGDDYPQLRARVLGGEPEPLPVSVPGWLARLVRRGLERDPARRHASMDDLLSRLERGPPWSARRLAAPAVAAIALAALAVVAVRGKGEPPCRGSDKLLTGVWDGPARAALQASFAAAKVPDPGALFARTAGILDGHAASWVAARTEACVATAVRREQSETLLDARMACLDGRLGELRALVEVLGRSENVTPQASAAALQLRPLRDCAESAGLAAWQRPPPAAIAAEVAALRMRNHEVRALFNTGRHKAAQQVAAEVVTAARRLGYRRLLLESLGLQTESLQLADPAATERGLTELMQLAADEEDDRTLAAAQINLLDNVGTKQRRPAEALAMSRLAALAVRRAGSPEDLKGTLLLRVGHILQIDDRWAEARILFEEAAVHMIKAYGADAYATTRAHVALLGATSQLGLYDEARRHGARVREIFAATIGADDSYEAAQVENELGGLEWRAGDFAAARRHYEAALDTARRLFGEGHITICLLMTNVGAAVRDGGAVAEARPILERALAVCRKARPEHPQNNITSLELAHALFGAGETAAARQLLEPVRVAYAKKPKDDEERARLFTAEAHVLIAEGRAAEAVPLLERAIAVHAADAAPDARLYLADASFALARALGPASPRARKLSASARATWQEMRRPARVAAVEAWLD